jgi:hypothetical protein
MKVPEDLLEFAPIIFVGAFHSGDEEGDTCLNVMLCAFFAYGSVINYKNNE